jgi:hypothetical protein
MSLIVRLRLWESLLGGFSGGVIVDYLEGNCSRPQVIVPAGLTATISRLEASGYKLYNRLARLAIDLKEFNLDNFRGYIERLSTEVFQFHCMDSHSRDKDSGCGRVHILSIPLYGFIKLVSRGMTMMTSFQFHCMDSLGIDFEAAEWGDFESFNSIVWIPWP